MAKDTTAEMAKKELMDMASRAEVDEAYFVGLLWSDPFENYSLYKDKLSQDELIHGVWQFYFELGRKMYEDGVKDFDTITVNEKVVEYNMMEDFEQYKKMLTIEDAMSIVSNHSDNIDYYYERIKKSYIVKQLYLMFGKKVLVNKNKYNWKSMNRDQLMSYWINKLDELNMSGVSNYEAENLYIDAEDFIEQLEKDSADSLPFYNSNLMNGITQGVARGHVFMWGGFGNSGKSSIMADKFVMSCIAHQEKLIVVLNEEDSQSFRQKIVLSILNHEFNENFDRKRMVNGELFETDKELIRKAFGKMKELIDGEESLIKVIFMERYVMTDLEKIIRFWANRGYSSLLIDTHKVSDDSKHDKRWEIFVEDMKTIYRLTRKNAGGLNLRTVVTFQLADSAIKSRWLDFSAIGEGKAAKNEASVVMMFRPMWSDEYPDGTKELEVYRWKKNERTGKYDKNPVKLDEGKTYYLLFTPKNRFGESTETGLAVMVLEPNFKRNAFYERGWTNVAKDYAS